MGVQLCCVLFSTGDRCPLWGVCGEQTPSSYVPALSSTSHDAARPGSPHHRPHHVWCCHPQWPVPGTGSVFRGHPLVVLSIVILLTKNHSVLSLAPFGLTGESHSVMSDTLRPCGLKPMRLLCPWNFLGQNTGMGSRTLRQGIFPTQGSNQGLLHCRWILYHLSQGILGSLRILEWVAYPFSNGSSLPTNQTGVSCIASRFFTSWATREAQSYWCQGKFGYLGSDALQNNG